MSLLRGHIFCFVIGSGHLGSLSFHSFLWRPFQSLVLRVSQTAKDTSWLACCIPVEVVCTVPVLASDCHFEEGDAMSRK